MELNRPLKKILVKSTLSLFKLEKHFPIIFSNNYLSFLFSHYPFTPSGFSFAVDGLSAAGLRVILQPVTKDNRPDGFFRVLWGTKDPTYKMWMTAEILYTFNKEHQVSSFCEAVWRVTPESRAVFRGRATKSSIRPCLKDLFAVMSLPRESLKFSKWEGIFRFKRIEIQVFCVLLLFLGQGYPFRSQGRIMNSAVFKSKIVLELKISVLDILPTLLPSIRFSDFMTKVLRTRL